MLLTVAWMASCAAPQTTRLRVEDFQAMAAAMAASLRASQAFAARGLASDPWVVSMQDVTNLSGDVIPEREQWALMAMVRGAQPIRTLWDDKQVSFVMPADRVRALRDSGAVEFEAFGEDRAPTHVLTATIRSVTRALPEARTDLYYAEFELFDFATGEPVWNDRFEFKRQALGAVHD